MGGRRAAASADGQTAREKKKKPNTIRSETVTSLPALEHFVLLAPFSG
jgi:hypothetical protein